MRRPDFLSKLTPEVFRTALRKAETVLDSGIAAFHDPRSDYRVVSCQVIRLKQKRTQEAENDNAAQGSNGRCDTEQPWWNRVLTRSGFRGEVGRALGDARRMDLANTRLTG
jgi:hypothetical protein